MNTIKLDLQDYIILIMFNLNQISFTCKEVRQEEGMEEQSNRTYDLPTLNVIDFEMDTTPMKYIRIFFDDKTHYQIKLESANEIVIDHFDNNGEIVEEIGCWDFYD